MEIKKEDLMTYDEFCEIIVSKFVKEIATTIALKLNKYTFIRHDMIYMLQSNVTYISMNKSRDKIINVVSNYIYQSYKGLTKSEVENIEKQYPKDHSKLFKNSHIETYIPQLICALEKNDIIFNVTPHEVHFENGYVDTSNGEFYVRDPTKHFITKCIKRCYKKSTEKQRSSVMKHIKKVYPDASDLECVLFYLGSALSWQSTKEQTALFLLGEGSTGKSFILSLTKSVMGCYFVELQSDAFSVQNNKIDKILNTYSNDPQILYSWVNEPKDTKMNGSVFKVWVDGLLQTTKLYEDGQQNFEHHSRCITTANTMPQIIVESGTTRRMLACTHHSKFVDKSGDEDKKKHVYVKDRDIIDKITTQGLLDAWFDMLTEYCIRWMKGEMPVYSDNFKETKDEVVSGSDIFQDFIDSKLQRTNKPQDKIAKDVMKKAFHDVYQDKHLTTLQVITSLKEHNLVYDKGLRAKSGIRGCFCSVRFKRVVDDDDEDDDVDHYNNGVSDVDQAVTVRMEDHMKTVNELKDFKAKYAVLEQKLANMTTQPPPLKSKHKSKTKHVKVIKVDADNESKTVGEFVESLGIFN